MPQLNLQAKWLRQQRNIAKGDIVMVFEENTPRARWPLGHIAACYPGKDNIVRVVDVTVAGKTYKRPVHPPCASGS